MAAPVVHFEIHGRNGRELAKFYDQLFEWKIEAADMPNGYYGLVAGGEGGIGGGIAESGEGAKVTVYVQVPDLDAKLKEIEEAGGKTIHPPESIPGVTFALFQDPEGNAIGLVQG